MESLHDLILGEIPREIGEVERAVVNVGVAVQTLQLPRLRHDRICRAASSIFAPLLLSITLALPQLGLEVRLDLVAQMRHLLKGHTLQPTLAAVC